MSLELGMAMARRFMDRPGEHDWLVLVPRGHAYLRFISDLPANHPATYDGTCESVTARVIAWLATRRDAVLPITPKRVLSVLPRFVDRKKQVVAVSGW
jgi:hypothetical protein